MKEIIYLFLFFFVIGCVGTIEDKNPDTTKGASIATKPLIFDGIADATAISDTKVEVKFFPASGTPLETTYIITYDGLDIPITIPAENLRTDYSGLLSYTVTGLSINRTYSFNVQATDDFGNKSSSDQIRIVSTFSNRTADFFGITTLSNLSGEDGRNSLKVSWAAATREGSIFLPKEIDPIQYEIVLLDADALTPAAFDDDSFGEPQRKVTLVDDEKVSHQVNGLQPGTRYYVRVRAIHSGYSENGANLDYLKERNSKYLELETLSDDSSEINVDLSDFNVRANDGSDGLTSLVVNWDAAQGAISSYRMYYRIAEEDPFAAEWDDSIITAVCDGQIGASDWYCKELNFNITSAILPDLKPLTNHEVKGFVCLNEECSQKLRYNDLSPYYTDPGLASFDGIQEIEGPRYFWSLDRIYLTINSPDLTSGKIDGLIVELQNGGEDDAVTLESGMALNDPTGGNTSSVVVESFDYATDTEIIIKGADTEVHPTYKGYCFKVFPFFYEDGVVIYANNEGRSLCYPQDQAEEKSSFTPSGNEFSGINMDLTSTDGATRTVNLAWSTPSGGIYDQFSIYVRDVSLGESFSFSDALAGDTDYIKIEVPYGENGYSLPFLASGSTYAFGVVTELSTSSSADVDLKFSEINTNIFNYSVP